MRDWVMKFNMLGPEVLIDRKAPGQASGTVKNLGYEL